jgi:preprotein translocase SecF subunit
MRFLDNINVDYLSKRRVTYLVSGALIIVSLFSLITRGLELGIDFVGGTEIALKFEQPIDIAFVRNDLGTIGLGNLEVKTFGGETGVLIRTELQQMDSSLFGRVTASILEKINSNFPGIQFTEVDRSLNSISYQFDSTNTAEAVSTKLFELGFQTSISENNTVVFRVGIADWIEESLRESMPENPFTIQKEDQVGPKIGEELKWNSFWAIIVALAAILVYLGFRFRPVFGFGAVVALFHDVLITLGAFSLLYGLIPGLNLEFSISVVAAFLTLVGYSINDTVVVFDRVRENLKLHKTAKLEDNINGAINRTMRRTIVTSATTLFVVTVLLIFGGDVLRGFAFTLFFGILIGTYSSIFVASPFVYEYATRRQKNIQF